MTAICLAMLRASKEESSNWMSEDWAMQISYGRSLLGRLPLNNKHDRC
jgi:hypothetical protein